MAVTRVSPLREKSSPSATPTGETLRRVKDWELGSRAGEGTWTIVYRARPAAQPDRAADYALKLVRPGLEDDPRAIGLLHRELTAGRSVSDPHVVSILGGSLRQPPYFLVMPWLAGMTLRKRLDRVAPLALHTALWIARQAASGLDALHRAGWVHGDLKPANLFLSPQGHVTLIDLGFARHPADRQTSHARRIAGTCTHLAPEILTGTYVGDIRSDLYSLGVVLYEMLAGRLPFASENVAELVQAQRQSAPPPLRKIAPHVPYDVADLVQRMLAKDPLRRPDSPAALVNQLTGLELDVLAARLA